MVRHYHSGIPRRIYCHCCHHDCNKCASLVWPPLASCIAHRALRIGAARSAHRQHWELAHRPHCASVRCASATGRFARLARRRSDVLRLGVAAHRRAHLPLEFRAGFFAIPTRRLGFTCFCIFLSEANDLIFRERSSQMPAVTRSLATPIP